MKILRSMQKVNVLKNIAFRVERNKLKFYLKFKNDVRIMIIFR